jgi:purine-binding chemotaxis protein CheW
MSSDDSSKIDWQEVWKILAWEDLAGGEDATQKRLRQRASVYAAPIQHDDQMLESGKTVLVFELGEERYGTDVMIVRSVRNVSHITRVPGTPPFYQGVVNVRGQVVTVLDMRLLFDISIPDGSPVPDELVVVRANGLEIALLAHNIEGVVTVPQAEIEPVDNIRYALGVTAERLVLLDIARLFEDPLLIVGGKDENT